ncbi:MAG: FecR family protein [Pyrinomonadaceae bacterium]|nr:FecR family protein [Pyrinomonadaceae bacterium]MCX7639825.1 FecR family protein [Pyrinomonadaceae bacterium]MDW8305351.1 FecR domain-containing protein [Acidobacteriota bacterium]
MQEPRYRKFYIDWWRIKKSTVYGFLFVLGFLLISVGSVWFLVKSGWIAIGKDELNFPANAARVLSFEGDVRIIRASTRSSEKVTGRTFVLAGDTIQTGADGRAEILMIDGSTLWIRPNSTVIIRDNSSVMGGTNVRVNLGGGQINVRTEDQSEASQNIVEVRDSQNRLFAQTEASFNINQKLGTGEIRISRGSVETTIGDERIIIQANEFASIGNGRITAKEKLLQPPKLLSPAALEQILANSEGKADVTFRWQEIDDAAGVYDFQVSVSPFFVPEAVIKESEGLRTTDFVLASLNFGTYYWRVRATSSSGQMSEWSEPWRFTVVKREESKLLKVTDWKVENLGGGVYRISARTEPGATVRIMGRETFARNDGLFTLQIRTFSDEIKVEILNESGLSSEYLFSLTKGKVLN